MPVHFSQPPFAAFCDKPAPDANLLEPISRCAPLVIPVNFLDAYLPLVSKFEYYVLLQDGENYNKDLIIKILDSGASKIITNNQALVDELALEDPSRIIFSESIDNAGQQQQQEQIGGAFVSNHTDVAQLANVRQGLGGKKSSESKPIFVNVQGQDISKSLADIDQINKQDSQLRAQLCVSISDIASSSSSTSSSSSSQFESNLSKLFLSATRTDRQDGLYTTIVTSHSPVESLGLVYSSAESIAASLISGQATYYSRSRNSLWRKGETSGATQKVVRLRLDCDGDAVEFIVVQKPQTCFCHTEKAVSCFGPTGGIPKLLDTLQQRRQNAPIGSYTKRLFNDSKLLAAKIREEADEVCRAETKEEIASEVADLLYFTMARLVASDVSLADVEEVLDKRSLKVTRRPGNAKPAFVEKEQESPAKKQKQEEPQKEKEQEQEERIVPPTYTLSQLSQPQRDELVKRPLIASEDMTAKVQPILSSVRKQKDEALRGFVSKLDRCNQASSKDWPLVLNAPFAPELMQIDDETKSAIDRAYANIHLFHQKQMDRESAPLSVETMPGVVCSRFARPIERVGCYVPGGTAVLPSTTLMLTIPALIAKCKFISVATPPSPVDGSIRPEIVYIAHKCGVSQIVKAGGAHAVGALAYGTESISKVDKIVGPGNQWVTAAKMAVSMDSSACVSIEMPAGPSEVLVIADSSANPAYVASDLLSQAEHGVDSQVVLLAIDLDEQHLQQIMDQIHQQASVLPRVDVIRQCLTKSSVIRCDTLDIAMDFSNKYAPEHLILHLTNLDDALEMVQNAGSVFLGSYSPESCGDYASGTNHTLPTYAYARQYSGVSTSTFLKHITAQKLTKEGIKALGPSVVRLAELEGLEAHANAVRVRLAEE